MGKTYIITIKVNASDDFYSKEVMGIKKEIETGKFQREMKSEGINSVKATFEEIN